MPQMKKNKLIHKLIFALTLSAVLIACSDDDGEGTSAGFAGIGSGYDEANGAGTVFVPFRDGSVDESDITVGGTATEGEDYTVAYGEDGITVSIIDDVDAEYVETVRFTIAGTGGESNRVHTVSIKSNDPGYLDIDLLWAGAPDMDLHMVYRADENDVWHLMPGATTIFSAQGFSDPGHLRLDWTAANGQYGFMYNYYAGSVEPLAITSRFTPTGTTVEGETAVKTFTANYMLVDKRDPGAIGDLVINQMFTKNGPHFTEFTDITRPD